VNTLYRSQQLACYPVVTEGSFTGGKRAAEWSRPQTSI